MLGRPLTSCREHPIYSALLRDSRVGSRRLDRAVRRCGPRIRNTASASASTSGCPPLLHGSSFRKLPSSIQYLGARAIEANEVVPTRHDGQTVCSRAVAAAELDRNGTILFLLRG